MIFLISIFSTIIVLFFTWSNKKYNYWKAKGITGPQPVPIFGNFRSVVLRNQSAHAYIQDVYNAYKDEKVCGIYQGFKPTLVVRDPEMIKSIMIKDFAFFQDRGIKVTNEPINDNLFSTNGEKWRILRHKLTPIFTSGKLKSMVPLIENCIGEFVNYVDKIVYSETDHEIRDLIGKYTLEVIGSCAFGVDMDAFSDSKNIFRDVANDLFNPPISEKIKEFVEMLAPGLRGKLYEIFKYAPLTNKTWNFFSNLVRKIVKEREGQPKMRNDFMDLMITLKEQGKATRRDDDKLSEIEINKDIMTAQALLFYAAGFETSAATMSFMLHELALNQDIQERLYKEIKTVIEKYDGKINYDSVHEMTYLEMVFDETLRKYPIVGILLRQAQVDYEFANSDIKVEKGTSIFIPVAGLHADPLYFPNPEKFDPERFSTANRGNISSCVYLPFGEGPRNCIGTRFAKVQSKLAMAAFLQKFQVTPTKKTKSVLEFDPKGVTLTAKDGIWMQISKR